MPSVYTVSKYSPVESKNESSFMVGFASVCAERISAVELDVGEWCGWGDSYDT